MKNPELKEKGLLPLYVVKKSDNSPTDPDARYFVLRHDAGGSDEDHISASRAALSVYAEKIKNHLPKLSEDLVNILVAYRQIPPPDSLRVYRIDAGDISHVAASDSLEALKTYIETTSADISDIESIEEFDYRLWFSCEIQYPDGDKTTEKSFSRTLEQTMKSVKSPCLLCSSEF
jgi:hypothetical protein